MSNTFNKRAYYRLIERLKMGIMPTEKTLNAAKMYRDNVDDIIETLPLIEHYLSKNEKIPRIETLINETKQLKLERTKEKRIQKVGSGNIAPAPYAKGYLWNVKSNDRRD